jgi:hypothetical protein
MKHASFLLVFFLTIGHVLADRGVLLVEKDINLAEPAQRAVVAHNGTWELLILQTEVKTDKATKALEFMPLPSAPEVSLAPINCFGHLQTLVTNHKLKYIVEFPRAGIHGPRGKTEAIKVVAEHNLGPHHITIVEIQNASKFRSWVTDFAKRKTLGTPIVTDELDKVVADYCQRGFRYMAFDVLDVPLGTTTIAPVSYRFKCDHIYYPLKVTNLYGGKGTVEVFYALNPWRDDKADCPDPYDFCYPLQEKKQGKRRIFSREVYLSTEELKKLDPIADSLFRNAGASFFATKYQGDLRFDNDIWLHIGYSSPEFLCMRFLSLLQEQDIDSLEFLIATPFALNHQETYTKTFEALAAIKDFTRENDLSEFRIKSRGSHSGLPRGEFYKAFTEKHGKRQCQGYYIFRSDKMSLHFLVINRNLKGLNDCKVISFGITPPDEYL